MFLKDSASPSFPHPYLRLPELYLFIVAKFVDLVADAVAGRFSLLAPKSCADMFCKLIAVWL